MADKFAAVTGAAAPLLLPNIDTDTIAPGQRKSQVGKAKKLSKSGTDIDMDNLFGNWYWVAAYAAGAWGFLFILYDQILHVPWVLPFFVR